METTIKVLPEMNVVCFEAYSPDSETKAFERKNISGRKFQIICMLICI